MAIGIYGKRTYEKERWMAYLKERFDRHGVCVELLDLEAAGGEIPEKAIVFTTGRPDELAAINLAGLDVPRQWVFYPLARNCKVNEKYLRFRLKDVMREEDTVVSARLDEGDAAVMMENLHDGKLTIGHLSRELVKAIDTQAAWILGEALKRPKWKKSLWKRGERQ